MGKKSTSTILPCGGRYVIAANIIPDTGFRLCVDIMDDVYSDFFDFFFYCLVD